MIYSGTEEEIEIKPGDRVTFLGEKGVVSKVVLGSEPDAGTPYVQVTFDEFGTIGFYSRNSLAFPFNSSRLVFEGRAKRKVCKKIIRWVYVDPLGFTSSCFLSREAAEKYLQNVTLHVRDSCLIVGLVGEYEVEE